MYSLLIVDDEPIIVNSLYNLFKHSEEFNLNVYKAYSGSEAMEKLKKIKIDIIITDICMPKIDGIKLQEEIVQHWPRCKVILLTGYDDFNYAQGAIRKGGVDYVLKIEGDEVICEAIKKAIEKISEEEASEKLILMAKEQMSKMLPFMQKEFFIEMLQGLSYFPEERMNRFSELKIPLKSDWPVLILLTRVDNWKNYGYSERNLEVIYKIQSIFEEYLKSMVNYFSIFMDDSMMLWFIQPRQKVLDKAREDEWNKVLSFVHGTLTSTQKSCRDLLGVSISHAVSKGFCQWEELAYRFEMLKLILNRDFGFGQEMILTDSQIGNLAGDTRYEEYISCVIAVQQHLKKLPMLSLYLEIGQKEEFKKVFSSIIEYMSGEKYMKYGLAAEVYYSIALVFQSCLNKMVILRKIADKMDLSKLMNMDKHASWNEINEYFQQLAKYVFEYRTERNSENNYKIIKKVQTYILEHLYEDLSLTALADVVYLNPAYLSRLYKQTTGQGLNEYILDIKLCKAREMLSNKTIKINKIAVKLGFGSHAYFCKFFKKHMQMTPQEYRVSL